jgi:hypothetical protein
MYALISIRKSPHDSAFPTPRRGRRGGVECSDWSQGARSRGSGQAAEGGNGISNIQQPISNVEVKRALRESHEGSEWEMRPSDGSLSFFPWILDIRCSILDILLVRFRGSFLLDIPRGSDGPRFLCALCASA